VTFGWFMSDQIAEYDPRWPELFESEAGRLREALRGLAVRIDHVGSTAVPGLAAKPTIDIQVVVPNREMLEACRPQLQAIGYSYTTVPVTFFYRPDMWPHSHHVHVRECGTFDERRLCLFRDWLREHEVDRRAYEELKRRLARGVDLRKTGQRMLYSEAKTQFVREIERRATKPEL
jgi:GrpB-like predicted nucleotidyltransferase (UPF0157 family)